MTICSPERVAGGSTASAMSSQRLFVVGEVRGEAALVADGGRESALLQDRLERVVDLDAGPQRLAKSSKPTAGS